MLAEIEVFGGDGVSSWSDRDGLVRLARAYRAESGPLTEAPVVHHHDCAVVLDGRLYEHRTDRAHRGDSVRVVEAYERWGDECVMHLDGDFVFALWDGRRQRLLCACDVMGRRTIAYFWDGKTFLACSRAVTLLRHPRVPRRIDGAYAAQTFCGLWSHPAGRTAFAAIRRLRPGFVLTLEDRRFEEKRVDEVRIRDVAAISSTDNAIAEFWETLDSVTGERLRDARAPGLLLSGGLDSACVASSMAATEDSIQAFSYVDEHAFDGERDAIRILLARYPHIRWHAAKPESDTAFVESTSAALVTDDPAIAGSPLLGCRLATWRRMVHFGIRMAVDGEGGDEIFGMAMRIADLVQARHWTGAMRHVLQHPQGRSFAWRGVLVPLLPRSLFDLWIARERRRRDPVPPWLRPHSGAGIRVEEAIAHDATWARRATFCDWLPALIENAPTAGTTAAVRLLRSGTGLESTSPLFDRRVAELASRVPARARLSPTYGKFFLRLASAGRVPDAVRWRPKRERLYYALLRASLASAAAQELSSLFDAHTPLASCVRGDVFRASLSACASGAGSNDDAERLHASLQLAGWWRRVEKSYGELEFAS